MECIDVIDTAVKVGLGALISGITIYFVTNKNHKHELNKEKRRRTESKLIDPIIENIDAHLSFMGTANSTRYSEEGVQFDFEKLDNLGEQEARILARVSSLSDQRLLNDYVDFRGTFADFRQTFDKDYKKDPFDVMNEASEKAGKLLKKLFELKQKD